MIRLTLLLLASIAVVMAVAGRGPVAPREPAGRSSETPPAGTVPAELVPRPNRLDLDDERGAVEQALAARAPAPDDRTAPDAPAAKIAPTDEAATIRYVSGNRVNMRDGPGTTYDVVGKLQEGDRVEVLEEPGDGWVKARVAQTGQTGWMADFLLAAEG